MMNKLQHRLTTSKARSHCILWPAQFGRKLVLCTRRKWPRPRRWQFFSRRDRDETLVRLETVSRPRPQPWFTCLLRQVLLHSTLSCPLPICQLNNLCQHTAVPIRYVIG